MEAKLPGADAEYESLVREQLTQLGYNSDAIPDEVLREFLADFEEKMEIGDGGAELSYPTALNSAEARSASRPPAAAKPSTPASGSGARRKAGAASKAAPAKPASQPSRGSVSARGTPAKPVAAAPPSLASAAQASSLLRGVPRVPEVANAAAGDEPMDIADADGEAAPFADDALAAGAGGAPAVPRFTPAQWEALRPTSASPGGGGGARSQRPHSARPASAGTPRGRGLGSASGGLGGVGGHATPRYLDPRPALGSASGVILTQSMIATPRQPKSDPVSLHAKRQAQWRSDSYLSLTTKRTGPPIDMAPAPSTVRLSRRTVNHYVVPTAKRRDNLVWETRQRLRNADTDAGGVGSRTPSKRLAPNMFVPVTEKRRDDLRWAVRTEMAWVR